jgi:acyl dehydratase
MQQTIKYVGPVKFGDTVHLEIKVAEKKESSKPDRGVVTFDATVLNQNSKPVIDGQWVCLMKRSS